VCQANLDEITLAESAGGVEAGFNICETSLLFINYVCF